MKRKNNGKVRVYQTNKYGIMKVTVIVETTDKNLSAYIEGIDGIIAVGHTLEELKESMKESIVLYLETAKEYNLEIPEALSGEYELVYKYDLCSFLNAYSEILSKPGLEILTGINQKQLWHYASGLAKPRPTTIKKVASSIRLFAKDLQNIQFA